MSNPARYRGCDVMHRAGPARWGPRGWRPRPWWLPARTSSCAARVWRSGPGAAAGRPPLRRNFRRSSSSCAVRLLCCVPLWRVSELTCLGLPLVLFLTRLLSSSLWTPCLMILQAEKKMRSPPGESATPRLRAVPFFPLSNLETGARCATARETGVSEVDGRAALPWLVHAQKTTTRHVEHDKRRIRITYGRELWDRYWKCGRHFNPFTPKFQKVHYQPS